MSNDPINCTDSNGQGKIWNWIKNKAKQLVNCIQEPSIIVDSITSGTESMLSAIADSLEKESVTQTYRPNNIGKGSYAKSVTSQAKEISKWEHKGTVLLC